MVLDVVRVNRELRAAFHHMFRGLCERLMKTFALFRCLTQFHPFECIIYLVIVQRNKQNA